MLTNDIGPEFNPGFEFIPAYTGAQVFRREDDDLLVGRGEYIADIQLSGMVEAAFLRSYTAHAQLKSVDLDAVRKFPGVLFAGAHDDLPGIGQYPDWIVYQQAVNQSPLADGRVRYVGAPVAVVVARDRYEAEDALELAEVDCEELPSVISIEDALAENAPLLFEEWGSNYILNFPAQDDLVDELITKGPVARGTYRMQRQSPCPMETRGVVAEYRRGRLTVWSSAQSPHILRSTISILLDIPESKIRVIAPNVGGGFGGKTHQYPEEIIIPWLAMKLGKPVRWIEDRTEHMVSAIHARDTLLDLEAAYDETTGRITALRSKLICDVGSGEISMSGTCTALVTGASITAGLKIPSYATSVSCVVTNKTPSGAYRGFGAPEAVFAVTQLMDKVARQTGLERADVHRELIFDPSDMPYLQPSGARIDSGSHREGFERILERLTPAVETRRNEYQDEPNVRIGSGFCQYVEPTAPTYFGTTGHWTSHDASSIRIEPDGGALVTSGVTSIGQGTETAIAALTADALGIPIEMVTVQTGDSDLCPYGLGAWGSRGAISFAGSILKAAKIVRDKAVRIAAHLLEASEQDVDIGDGGFHVKGSPASFVSWADVGLVASIRTLDLPDDIEPGLEETAVYDPANLEHRVDEMGRMNGAASWANGAQACVVKVETDTGVVTVLDYFTLHDCGPMINPQIVDGQMHGAVAQGIAGALFENIRYDENGQPLSTSFMDYSMPTASEIPSIHVDHLETPAPEMPLGLKGVGEGGTIGPAAVIAAAVTDALHDLGVVIDETPITPSRVRAALRRASDLLEGSVI